MFDIGWSEILILAVVTIIVVGPKDLPRLLKNVGQIARKLRATANEFRGHLDDVIRDAELEDLKSTVDDVRGLNPVNQIRKAIDDEVKGVRDIVEDMEGVNHAPESEYDESEYDDFDDPGAEWSDEDDEGYQAPKTKTAAKTTDKTAEKSTGKPADAGDGKPGTDGKTVTALNRDGPNVNWTDDDLSPAANDASDDISSGDDISPKSPQADNSGEKAASGRG